MNPGTKETSEDMQRNRGTRWKRYKTETNIMG